MNEELLLVAILFGGGLLTLSLIYGLSWLKSVDARARIRVYADDDDGSMSP